jgi:hypothetical protein
MEKLTASNGLHCARGDVRLGGELLVDTAREGDDLRGET